MFLDPGYYLLSAFDALTEQEIAAKFFRTLSSHGKRPDPASRAALHRTRVRSAVMTPTRKQRQERETQNLYQQMSRCTLHDIVYNTSFVMCWCSVYSKRGASIVNLACDGYFEWRTTLLTATLLIATLLRGTVLTAT